MSASDKKKIRKEQATAFLTEKQKAEQAEAKKLKVYTVTFVTAMLLIVVVVLGVLGVRAVNNSGVFQKNTIAATIGENKLNSVELAYYYNDAINEYYSNMYNQFTDYTDSYLEIMGLDKTKPLTEQIQDQETNKTWATYFLEEALNQAKIDYAMYAQAVKDDFELPEEERTNLDSLKSNLETYAKIYGFSNSSQYLRAVYGYGADADSYVAYTERSVIADAYITEHHDTIDYDDAAIREYETGKEGNYNSYTYDYCYLSYTDFRTGGTEDENGNKTYTDEENNAARAAAKAAAEQVATATNLEELKAKAEAVQVNEDSEVAVNEHKDELFSAINGTLGKWLSEADRKEGDIAVIPNESTTTNEDGTETTLVNGYYVAMFHSKSDNKVKMGDVRHLLVEFEGGTQNEETEQMEYTEAEKNAAKTKADEYFKTWTEGDKTEDSFIALVKEHSDDTSAEDGGLFENVHPNASYTPNFLNWAIAEERKAGDCEVIETEFGYHVMYYVGDSKLNYRDYMIFQEMRDADHEEWYNGIVDAASAELADTSKMKLDVTLG